VTSHAGAFGPLVTGQLRDVLLLRPPGVYRVDHDTHLLAAVLEGRVRGRTVLDVCTGTGALALTAARAGAAAVTAVDLSRRSALAARLNARLHGAPVSVHRGDLFEPVRGRRFDVVTANPPYVPAHRQDPARYRLARCWDAGHDGRLLLDRIARGLPDVLVPGGRALLVHSAVCGEGATLESLEAAGMDAAVVARAEIPFGPVMRARAALMLQRGLIEAGQTTEEIVVVEGRLR
jgi:release factor glutamine methyltransferase